MTTARPRLRMIILLVDVIHKVSLRIVTMPIQSQGIITRDNVSVDVSAVFPVPLISTIEELVAFLTRENGAAQGGTTPAITQPDGAAAR